MAKRRFIIDLGGEKIEAEGHQHRNVAVRYLMKRRRSLLMTRDSCRAEILYARLPRSVSIIGGHATKAYRVTWERRGTVEFEGSRFVFALEELDGRLGVAA